MLHLTYSGEILPLRTKFSGSEAENNKGDPQDQLLMYYHLSLLDLELASGVRLEWW